MSSVARGSLVIGAGIFLAAVLDSSPASGQTPAEEPAAPLVYRRVYVPEEALESQIRGLFPLKRDEFERRIALVRAAADQSSGLAQVRMEEAVFRARLEGNFLRDGVAEIVVSSAASQPLLLAIAPCSVAIESAAWQDRERRGAVIGADSAGVVQCLVEASGTLRFTWSLAAAASTGNETTFDLRIPAATRRRLEITAPKNMEMAIDGGLIIGSGPSRDDPEQRVWSMELGGKTQTRLTARNAGRAAAYSSATVR